jgi:hypothetical protein
LHVMHIHSFEEEVRVLWSNCGNMLSNGKCVTLLDPSLTTDKEGPTRMKKKNRARRKAFIRACCVAVRKVQAMCVKAELCMYTRIIGGRAQMYSCVACSLEGEGTVWGAVGRARTQ